MQLNHRMVGVGRDLCGLHRTLSRWILNISREGDSTTSLGSLCQCSITLRVKKFFLTSVQLELPLLQFVPIAPCPVAEHHWKESLASEQSSSPASETSPAMWRDSCLKLIVFKKWFPHCYFVGYKRTRQGINRPSQRLIKKILQLHGWDSPLLLMYVTTTSMQNRNREADYPIQFYNNVNEI